MNAKLSDLTDNYNDASSKLQIVELEKSE